MLAKCWQQDGRLLSKEGRKRGFQARNQAERVGFEPTEACTSTVFETAPIDHSGTSPRAFPPDCSAGHLDCQSFGRCSVFGWQQHQHARVLDLAGRTPNTPHRTPTTLPRLTWGDASGTIPSAIDRARA